MKTTRTPLAVALVCAIVLALFAGCAAEDDPDEVPGPNTIQGVVLYEGSLDGSLIVGAFTSFPPQAGPVSFVSFPTPTFPAEYELTYVPAGDYYVIATLDVGRDDPTAPGDEDIMAASVLVSVSDAEGAVADVDLAEAE